MNTLSHERIYLDTNASAPLCAAAKDAMVSHLEEGGENPSSVHAEGRAGRAALERARRQVAVAIGAQPAEVVLTSSATEANNLAIKGASLGAPGSRRRGLVTTAAEHPSVSGPLGWLAGVGQGFELDVLAVDGSGRVTAETVSERVGSETLLVSVIGANNETGAISPIREIGEAVRRAGALFHVDAAQTLGRIPVSVTEWNADLVTFSSHKAGGPRGAGALWVRPGLDLEPLHHGGHQERNRRGGTESVLNHVGFGAACEAAVARHVEMWDRVGALRDRLWAGLGAAVPDALRLSPTEGCLPNTLLAAFPGVEGEALLMALDMAGIAVSTGSACTVGSLEPSHVLLAMGIDETIARSAVRFSLGLETRPQDIDRTLALLSRLLPQLRGVT